MAHMVSQYWLTSQSMLGVMPNSSSVSTDEGTFKSCMSGCLTNPSHSGDDSINPDQDDLDATDTSDAIAFEIFNSELQVDHPAVTTPVSDLEPMPQVEASAQPSIQLEADDSASTTESLVVIDQFPFGNPGAPISGTPQGSSVDDTGLLGHDVPEDSIWAPFLSKRDWDIMYWVKRHNITSSAMAELLAIPEVRKHILIYHFPTNAWRKVVQSLGLSYSTTKKLNDKIDSLPGHPPFLCREVTIGDEVLKFYYQDILASIRTLYGNPDFH